VLITDFVKNVSAHLLTVAASKQETLMIRRGRRHRPWVVLVNPELWARAEQALAEKEARDKALEVA